MKNLDSGTRLGTMLLDHVIMTVIMMVFVAPGIIYDVVEAFGNPEAEPKLFLGNYYLSIFAFSLYFNKDIFTGRSPAKRILRLQIIDIHTNKPANSIKCLTRNLTIIIWPVEVIMALVNNERRLGDYIAGTKLVRYNFEEHRPQLNWLLIFLAIVLSVAITYFGLFYPFEVLMRGAGFKFGVAL